jgi:hypothetical protein
VAVIKEKCSDCPAVAERREADAKYRGIVLTKLDVYDKTLTEMKEAIITLTATSQRNFNAIYFRIGFISGGAGLLTGAIATLITLHLHK